jgi:hypothetical protein
MNPKEFKNLWLSQDDQLNPINADLFKGFNLNEISIDFLVNAGLPINAAPYLTFSISTQEKYNSISKLTDLYSFLKKEYERYISIGSDGSGNPVVIRSNPIINFTNSVC